MGGGTGGFNSAIVGAMTLQQRAKDAAGAEEHNALLQIALARSSHPDIGVCAWKKKVPALLPLPAN